MLLNRRQFLGAAAAATAAGAAGTTAYTLASGEDYTYQGIDVSHWQGSINWTSVKNSGKTFAFCKATEGIDFQDEWFSTNWAGMKNNGLIRGAYHMGRPAVDPVAQANYFHSYVNPVKDDLQLVLDLEKTDGRTPSQVRAWVVAFTRQIAALTGRPAIIYTGFYFWRDSAGNGSNLNCPLWLPAYRESPYTPDYLVPAAWKYLSFWQYTSTGSVPGVSGDCDRDIWNGSLNGLKALRLP